MSKIGPRRALQVLCAILAVASCGAVARADEALDREYRIKAAFVYNFLKFVEGGRLAPTPEKKGSPDGNDVLVLGILGTPPSKLAFEEFKGKMIGNRAIVIRWFKGFEESADKDGQIPEQHPDLEPIRACHVLFVCSSEKAYLPRLLLALRDNGVLAVGDVPDFLEAGGTINLLVEEKRIRFEINLAAATRAKLVIRSSLLRLAARTIEHDRLESSQSQEQQGATGHS